MSENSYLDLETYEGNENDEDLKYLTFLSNGKLFAVKISQIVQIAGKSEIDQVPEFPDYVKGIICIRGNIIPVIDFAARVGLTSLNESDSYCTIIMDVSDQLVAIVVDSVCDIIEIPENKIMKPNQAFIKQIMEYFIDGIATVNDKTTFVIDVDKVLLANDKDFVLSYDK